MPFDMGLYTAYEKQRDDSKADVVEAIFILGKHYGTSKHLFNLILEQQIGSHREDDMEWGLAWSSMWKVCDDAKLGFEYYAEFGEFSDMHGYNDQSHQIGPVAEFELPGTELEMKLGYFAGISRSAFDSTVKWELEWEF